MTARARFNQAATWWAPPLVWRILGAIEGVNGVILLGWSTAFFVSVVSQIRAPGARMGDALSPRPNSTQPG